MSNQVEVWESSDFTTSQCFLALWLVAPLVLAATNLCCCYWICRARSSTKGERRAPIILPKMKAFPRKDKGSQTHWVEPGNWESPTSRQGQSPTPWESPTSRQVQSPTFCRTIQDTPCRRPRNSEEVLIAMASRAQPVIREVEERFQGQVLRQRLSTSHLGPARSN